MSKLDLVIRALCLLTLSASATSAHAQLTAAARQSLTRWNFKFKTFAETDFTPEVIELFKTSGDNEKPMMLTLDLNNDKIQDFVLLGEADKQQYVIALLSHKKEYKTVVVESWSDPGFKKSSIPGGNGKRKGVPVYLAIPASDDPATIALKNKAKAQIFDVEAYMGSTKVFAIKGNKAEQLSK